MSLFFSKKFIELAEKEEQKVEEFEEREDRIILDELDRLVKVKPPLTDKDIGILKFVLLRFERLVYKERRLVEDLYHHLLDTNQGALHTDTVDLLQILYQKCERAESLIMVCKIAKDKCRNVPSLVEDIEIQLKKIHKLISGSRAYIHLMKKAEELIEKGILHHKTPPWDFNR